MKATRALRGSICVMLLSASCVAHGQRVTDRNSHLWISHFGDHKLSDHWSFHTEVHIRQAEMGAMPQQLLIRPAINFHLNPEVMFTAGYSYYYNYRYGAWPIKTGSWEHQAYQQIQFTARVGKVALQHRYRMEERFIALQNADPSSESGYTFDTYLYQSRFRVRLMATLPLGKREKVEPKAWFLSAYDELFLNFGDNARLDLMNQNRISGLVGYQFNKQGNVQVGYQLQTLQRPGAANGADLVEMNSTLHVILTYNLDLRKPKTTPSAEPVK
ncbi:MAG: DUF2490 domain-containing protein [Flavobacteriales bacterium]|nr:DUF2490 domain-containing protein [Flavobacteriales bacterium]